MAGNRALTYQPSAISRFFEVSLLGMLACGYLALAGSRAIDLPSAISGGIALLARALMLAGLVRFEIPGRIVTILTLAYLLFVPVDYRYLSGDLTGAVVHLVFFVAIVKILTARSPRDFFLLQIIAFLEFLAASILSVNLTFFLFLILFLLCAVANFSSGEIRRAAEGRRVVTRGAGVFSRRLISLAFFSTCGILLITAVLFFLLPRTARAAFDRLLPPASRTTGFASEITLGQTGEIRRSAASVFHVRFEEKIQPAGLYWRGAGLAEFNGWKWYNSHAPGKLLRPDSKGLVRLVDDDQLRRIDGTRLTFQVFLDTGGSDVLFTTGLPEHLQIPVTFLTESPTGGFRLPFSETAGFRYAVYSFFPAGGRGGPAPAPLLPDDRNFYLRLPPVDKRIIALAREITAGATSDEQRARLIENYLSTNFAYSLDALDREVDDPLGHFILERKKGHCEYFASAMAAMLRIVWVPARVASGFRGGSYNPLSGWYVIRASEAHTWVEAWLPGRGWVAFDPTPPDPNPPATSLLSRLSLWADAIDMFWQDWVISYDLDRQLTLAFRVDQSRRRISFSWADDALRRLRDAGAGLKENAPKIGGIALMLLIAVSAALLLGPQIAAAIRWSLGRRRAARGEARGRDASLLYDLLLHLMRKRGFDKLPSLTPREFAARIPRDDLAPLVSEFTGLYYELRFGGRTTNAAALAQLLDRLNQLP